MTSTITGVGSGFDINGWVSSLVSVKQQSLLSPLETKLNALETKNTSLTSLKSKYSTLQSTIRDFTNLVYNSGSDIWTNTSITSSNDAYATATSGGSVSATKIELFIEKIATATVAKSAHSIGAISKEGLESTKFTNLANGQAKTGSFSMFLNGKEFQIEEIVENDTLADVINKINKAGNGLIKAEVDNNGNFSIKAYKTDENGQEVVDNKAELILGSSGDTSNLVSALKLHTAVDGGFQSDYPVTMVNTAIAMSDSTSGLSNLKFFDENGNETDSGKIFINGEELEITSKMSINDVISKINGNSKTGVKASYDSLNNTISLTSIETGRFNISLSSEGTNLLNVLGLTEGEGDNEIIAKNSQELGENAIAYINGNKVISNSNTITGASSGIANLSITIKKPTSEYSGNEEDDKSVTLDIEPDYTKVKEKLQAFVKAYNDVVETTTTMTKSDGKIGRDSSLTSILSNLKSITSEVSKNEGAYNMLAQIGITSDKNDVSKLTIDNSKLDKALSENLDSVKKLLSDGYVSKEDNGIFDSILKDINSAMDSKNGYFVKQSESVQNQISSMNSRIERANQRLLSYQNRITKQFNAMDSTISKLNSQMSSLTSILG